MPVLLKFYKPEEIDLQDGASYVMQIPSCSMGMEGFKTIEGEINFTAIVLDEDGHDSGISYLYNEENFPGKKAFDKFFDQEVDAMVKIVPIGPDGFEVTSSWFLCPSDEYWNAFLS